MEATTATAIMRGFEAVRPAPTEITDRRWKWAAGVHVFPEAVCPFCKAVMRSTCIWLVTESAQRLELIVKPIGKLLRKMDRKHPHVHSNGSICMNGYSPSVGNASNAAEALFLAIYPRSTMGFGRLRNSIWERWFADYFGHTKHDDAGLKRRSRPKRIKAAVQFDQDTMGERRGQLCL